MNKAMKLTNYSDFILDHESKILEFGKLSSNLIKIL